MFILSTRICSCISAFIWYLVIISSGCFVCFKSVSEGPPQIWHWESGVHCNRHRPSQTSLLRPEGSNIAAQPQSQCRNTQLSPLEGSILLRFHRIYSVSCYKYCMATSSQGFFERSPFNNILTCWSVFVSLFFSGFQLFAQIAGGIMHPSSLVQIGLLPQRLENLNYQFEFEL